MVGEGPPRLADMYPFWSQNTNIKWYMDAVKSNLLFSNVVCRISEAYIFRLFKKVPILTPKAHRGNCQLTYSHFFWINGREKIEIISWSLSTKGMWPGWGSNSWPLYMTDKESVEHPTALLDPSWGSNLWPFYYRLEIFRTPYAATGSGRDEYTYRFSWLYPSYKRVDIVL